MPQSFKLLLGLIAVCLVVSLASAARVSRPRFPFTGARSVVAENAPLDSRLPPYTTNYYTQQLDHFNFQNDQTWQQRYLVVDSYWKAGRPILFYTGNEGDIMMFYNNTGFMFELAKKWNALIIFAEHRYYGKSLPFGNKSFLPQNTPWLTAEQALADFAQLLRDWKKNPVYANSPVVAFGGSYGGMLTAWFRMAYPNIVVGGLASSAPVVQFVGLYPDFSLFNKIVTDDYTKVDPKCTVRIRSAFNTINNAGPSLYSTLTQKFKLCRPLQSSDDIQTFIGWLESAITYMAMTNYPDSTNFLQPLPAWPVTAACQKNLAGGDDLDGLYAAVNVYYNTSGTQSCNSISEPESGGLGDDGWNYQACSELALPSSSNGVTDFFPPSPFVLSQYSQMCQATQSVKPRYTWIPLQYGGFNITAHSNIIFSNGDLDPWSGGGILETLAPSLPAIIIEQAAHHLDLRFSTPSDPQSVVVARQQEETIMLGWIRDFYRSIGIPSPL